MISKFQTLLIEKRFAEGSNINGHDDSSVHFLCYTIIYLPDPVISPSPSIHFANLYTKCLSRHVLATKRASSGSDMAVKR